MITQEVIELLRTGANDKLQTALENDPVLADGHTDQGLSLLLLACYYRNVDAAELIKKYKTNVDLYEACSLGDFERVKELIRREPDSINSFSVDGFSPLGLACFFGQHDIAKYLIERGADVNQPSKNQFNVAPIHSSCAISDYPLTELLIKNGADVNAKQAGGVTPLHEAAHNGQKELVILLIENKADVNAKTEKEQTPLAMATEKGFSEVADLIVKYGGK